MAVDIVPELLNDILDHFEEAWHDNGKLSGLVEKLKNGTATYAEANEYAAEVGRMMKEAYMANLSSDRLPDGKCYYNIADRIIRETEHMQYVRVSDYAMKVQSDLNKKAGIGLKAIAPEEDTGLVQSLINKAANADQYDDVSAYVSQTMESMARKTVDHSVKANADFQYKAGMRPRIIRSGGSRCCEWCSGLTGKYDYPDVPKDVYARHNNCSCTVEYVPGDGKRQNVWSKNWISEEDAQRREELKTLGIDNSEKVAKIEYRKNISFAEQSLRTKSSGDYGVNWKIVKSKEYTERFNALSDNNKANMLAARRARNALVNRNGKKTEEMYAISLTSGKDVSKIIDQHIEFGVNKTDKFIADIARAEERGEMILLIHNHPGGTPPSIVDVNELLNHKNTVGITVGHDGSLYYYTKPDRKIVDIDIKVANRKAKVYNDEKLDQESFIEELAKSLGFEFRKL